MVDAEPPVARKKIRWFVVLAVLIMIGLAVGGVIAIGDEVLSREAMEGRGLFFDQWVEAGVGACVGALAAFVIWLGFHLLVFRHRARLWKSILVLVLMILIGALIATPARLITVAVHVDADDATVDAFMQEGIERRTALRERMAPNLDGLRLDQGAPPLTSTSDIVAHKAAINAAREQLQAYRAAVTQDLADSRAALDTMDIHPDAAFRGYEYYDERLSPASNTQRHLDLTERILARGSDLLGHLLANRRGWIVVNGRVEIIDPAFYEEMNERGRELDIIGAELDNVQGALGRGLDGSRVLGSDVEREESEN